MSGAEEAELQRARYVLEEAGEIINADRMDAYGHPIVNFNRIAGMWTAFLTEKLGVTEGAEEVELRALTGEVVARQTETVATPATITATDVAAMMMMVKLSRVANDPAKVDSWVDIAGYAALGSEVNP